MAGQAQRRFGCGAATREAGDRAGAITLKAFKGQSMWVCLKPDKKLVLGDGGVG
jgi:hypothetical protein